MRKLFVLMICLAVVSPVALATRGVDLVCAAEYKVPTSPFNPKLTPPAPDYSLKENWAALPQGGGEKDVDVVFIHPTSYFGDEHWNQPMADALKNQGTIFAIRTKAGVFEKNCNVYAPFYRQASFHVLDAGQQDKDLAVGVAYEDIARAFDYYLAHFNQGKPFILAGHSQGSNLLLWLMERRFSDPTLMKRLVAAYLIGWSVTKDDLKQYPQLKLSESFDQTGCIITYNTQEKDAETTLVREGAIGVNPLLWNTSGEAASSELNLGAVIPTDGGLKEILHYTEAQTVNGALIVPRPSNVAELKTPCRGLYHSYDYAFFYRNIEQNVADRIESYQKRH